VLKEQRKRGERMQKGRKRTTKSVFCLPLFFRSTCERPWFFEGEKVEDYNANGRLLIFRLRVIFLVVFCAFCKQGIVNGYFSHLVDNV
jgi:hypothetical protein